MAPLPIDLGSVRLALRADSPATDALLRQLLAPHRARSPRSPYLSVQLVSHRAEEPGTRGLSVLYRGGCAIARTRHPGTLLVVLLGRLECLRQAYSGELVALPAVPVIAGSEAVLVPATADRHLAYQEQRLNDRGLAVVHDSLALIDPATHELVVPGTIPHDTTALEGVGEAPIGSREIVLPKPGRYRVATVLHGRAPGDFDPMPPDAAAIRLLRTVANARQAGATAVVRAVGGLVADARHLAVRDPKIGDLPQAVADRFAAGSRVADPQ